MNDAVKKVLPPALTTYDIFKFVAVALMVVDHIGYYFYPDELWWRVAGRLCVPIWFFLVGYARSRDMGPAMWAGMALLVAGSVASGMYVFPLNILATILVVRMVLDPLMDRALGKRSAFWALNGVLFALVLPTMMLVEYGTQALVLAIFGYITRRLHEGDSIVDSKLQTNYMIFSVMCFLIYQSIAFGFAQDQALALAIGTMAVHFTLLLFRPGTVKGTEQGAGHMLSLPIQLIGRHTLFIYVAHLLAFKGLGLLWRPDTFQFMNGTWFMPVSLY